MDAQKPAPKLSHVNNFDLIRLFAACQVVVVHATAHLKLPSGWFQQAIGLFPGVPIFYAISGFLICASLEGKSHNMRKYWTNRILRLFPGLWVCTAVTVVLMAAFGALTLREAATPSFLVWLFGQLTFFQFLPSSVLRDFGMGTPNGSLPTISFELQFYVVLPLLYWLGRKLALKGKAFDALLAVLMLLSYGTNILKYGGDGTGAGFSFSDSAPLWMKGFMVTFIPHIWMFFAGALIYRNWERLQPILIGKGLYWIAGYLALNLSLEATGNHFLSAGSGFVLALAVVATAYTAPTISDRVLRRTDISYGVYLYHMPIINSLIEMGRTGLGSVWLLVPSVLIAALLSRFLVESPALRLKDRRKAVPAIHPA